MGPLASLLVLALSSSPPPPDKTGPFSIGQSFTDLCLFLYQGLIEELLCARGCLTGLGHLPGQW